MGQGRDPAHGEEQKCSHGCGVLGIGLRGDGAHLVPERSSEPLGVRRHRRAPRRGRGGGGRPPPLPGRGGGGVAATHIDGSHDDEYIYPIGLAGGLIFGAAGYFICKALAKEEEAPPPPPPPPRAPPPPREKIVLRGVNFDFDKANIRPDAAVILDEAVHLLGSSGPSVSVEGHTDALGTDAYNQGLSARRATSAKT